MATLDEIKAALDEVGSTFKQDELAYIALTGKVERPIQNHLAYLMHQQLQHKFIVAREWKGVDIAIFEKDKPRTLIELKAMYNFDGHTHAGYFTSLMLDDEKKARGLATEEGSLDADVYSILLAAHPKSAIPSEYKGTLKYVRQIDRAYLLYETPEKVMEEAQRCLDVAFGERKIVHRGLYEGGCAFGVHVDVHYWLVKAPVV